MKDLKNILLIIGITLMSTAIIGMIVLEYKHIWHPITNYDDKILGTLGLNLIVGTILCIISVNIKIKQ